MLLRYVQCEGYKAFSAPTRIDLRPLTVIFGRNNSGKTTLARLPMFATASLAEIRNGYVLSSGELRFGSTFAELASIEQAHPRVSFAVGWDDTPAQAARMRPTTLGIDLQLVTTGVEQHDIRPRQIKLGEETMSFDVATNSGQTIIQSIGENYGREERSSYFQAANLMQTIVRQTIHIPGGRSRIQSTYATREPNRWTVTEVPFLLATNTELMAEVSAWYREHLSGILVDIDQAAFAFRLVEIRNQSPVSLSESGRGTQAVLPVVSLLLGVARGWRRAQLVVVEEPEEHLHPSAHGAIGDLLIEASSKATVVTETHSENLILRLRRRIAQRELDASDVAFYYVSENHEVVQINVDQYGAADNWPMGVFESDAEEAQAIVEAKLSAMGLGRGDK
nr:AAA family ATPase [Dactylosporangium thailandense]